MIRASDLLGARVRTESGRHLGRVHDLRAERSDGAYRVTALIVRRAGILARFVGGATDAPRGSDLIPWQAITKLADGHVTIADSTPEP
jgi:sporulation protein YlmC with PRC-barrel domain